jgi:hypothetical protein
MNDTVTLYDLPALKKAYKKAVEVESEAFLFKETLVLTKFAKYLIEYLESLK